jgi:UDP-glucose 4-epimerase
MKADVTDEVFNVASGVETSLRQLCEGFIAAMGVRVAPQHVPLPAERKAVEVLRRLADVSKAERLLGFRAAVGLDEGLRGLVRWLDAYGEAVK